MARRRGRAIQPRNAKAADLDGISLATIVLVPVAIPASANPPADVIAIVAVVLGPRMIGFGTT